MPTSSGQGLVVTRSKPCPVKEADNAPGYTTADLGKGLLVTDFGDGIGCPGELGGGSDILTSSAIIPRDHPQGRRHAGSRTLVQAPAGAEDHLHPLLAAAV